MRYLPQQIVDTRDQGLSWIPIMILVLAKLWLVLDQPLFAITDASQDDLLFVRLADHLAQLQWLGPYDNLTLAKGPFYPMWIAFAFLAGVPLLLSQHLLYIAACLVTERALQPLIPSRLWRTAILILLLFNPATVTWQLTRVLRESLYTGLTLLVVGSAMGLFARCHNPARCLVGWAITCGLAIAAFWLTREEGVWILPFLAPLLLSALAAVVFSNGRDWRKIVILALPMLLPVIIVQLVAMANLVRYEVYATVEFKTPEFKAAYGALTRVRPTEHKPGVPVTKETRLRIYQASPTFAQLRSILERDGFWTLRTISQGTFNSDEIGGGWFMWALREAAASAGYFSTGKQAASFFQRLADEVNAACQDKRLDCLAERASLMPPWRSEYLAPVINKIMSGFVMLVTFAQVSPDPISSSRSPTNLLLFQDMTREKPSGRAVIIRGWVVHAPCRKLTVALIEPDINETVISEAQFYSSPDVYQYFLHSNQDIACANKARFEVWGRCIRRCVLRVSGESGVLADISLKKGQTAWFTDPFWVFIDEFSSDVVLPRQARLEEFKLFLLEKITVLYRLTIPYLAVIAFIAMSIWLFHSIKNRMFKVVELTAASIAAAVCMRLLILAIIDTTSFAGITVEYLSPLYPMVLLCSSMYVSNIFRDSEQNFNNSTFGIGVL